LKEGITYVIDELPTGFSDVVEVDGVSLLADEGRFSEGNGDATRLVEERELASSRGMKGTKGCRRTE